MHSSRLLGLILILFFANSPAFASDDSYICVAESSVGFNFNKTSRQWERSNFKTRNKYIVRKSFQLNERWEVNKIGTSEGITCEGDFDENNFIRCNGSIAFFMNNTSLRFIVVHPWGYVINNATKDNSKDEGSVTPYLEIGKCSPP